MLIKFLKVTWYLEHHIWTLSLGINQLEGTEIKQRHSKSIKCNTDQLYPFSLKNRVEWGSLAIVNFKMEPKRIQIQCLVCKKMMGSKNLKRHCKTVHGMNDEEYKRIKIKIHSCKYCKKLFARSINCLYHEIHCQPRKDGDVSYRADFQFGAGTETNGGFEEIQHGLDRVFVSYRKHLSQNSDMDNLKSALTTDAITVLQKEVAVQI